VLLPRGYCGFDRSDRFILIGPQTSDAQFTFCDFPQIAGDLIEPLY
jgi:hypothetical protein